MKTSVGITIVHVFLIISSYLVQFPVVGPDLELRGPEGAVLVCLPCRLSSFCDFFPYIPKIRWGRVPRPPYPRSATGLLVRS